MLSAAVMANRSLPDNYLMWTSSRDLNVDINTDEKSSNGRIYGGVLAYLGFVH